MRNKVPLLQAKLSHAAKQSLLPVHRLPERERLQSGTQTGGRRFGALYDKIYRSDVLWTAWNLNSRVIVTRLEAPLPVERRVPLAFWLFLQLAVGGLVLQSIR